MPESRTEETPHGLSTALRVSVQRLARQLRQEGQRDGLTPSQLAALSTIDKKGPLTLGELATAERVQPPSMTRVVAALEAGGFVSRSADPSDGRVVLVDSTRAGRAAMNAIRRRRDAWLEVRLRELPSEELELLRRAAPILERLAGAS